MLFSDFEIENDFEYLGLSRVNGQPIYKCKSTKNIFNRNYYCQYNYDSNQMMKIFTYDLIPSSDFSDDLIMRNNINKCNDELKCIYFIDKPITFKEYFELSKEYEHIVYNIQKNIEPEIILEHQNGSRVSLKVNYQLDYNYHNLAKSDFFR